MNATDIKNGVIAGLVMLAIAGAAALYGALTGVKMREVEATYHTAQAKVTKRSQETIRTDDNLFDTRTVSSFKVELEYTVDGITYQIKRKSKWNLAEGFTAVYYNPENPKKVYTEEQVLALYYRSWYIFAGIIGGLGLSVVIYVLTQIGRPVK